MKLKLAVPAVALLTCALVVPAFAGGAHCAGKSSASSATAVATGNDHCASGAKSAAWAGAWLERSASGQLTVAAVASGSPAARSGLRAGDRVVAVNGRDLYAQDGAGCLTSAECQVGAAVAYTVQRGKSTKIVNVKLEKLPQMATSRYSDRDASFDPTLAAVVITSID